MMANPDTGPRRLRRLPDPAFWSGRRVMLTGHTSFIGCWTALWLERLGAVVMGFSLAPAHTPNLYEQARIAAAVGSHFVDLRDRSLMEMILESLRFDVVLHLAVRSPPSHGNERDGAEPTNSLLQALRILPRLKAVLMAAGYDDDPSARAERTMDAAMGSDVGLSFETAGIPLASARAGLLIGGGDYGDNHLIPNILRAYDADVSVDLQDPHAVHPWQHVLDGVAGYLVYLERLSEVRSTPRTMRFFSAPGSQNMTEGQVASLALKALNRRQQAQSIESGHRRHPGQRPAHERFGFKNRLNTRQALAWTLDWYRRLSLGDDPKDITLSQIAAYERRG